MDIQKRTFGGTYPFKPRYVTVNGLRLHYVDEKPKGKSKAEPIVMLHGNPTWSYLYRNFVAPLVKAGYRCIVPDHMGYGKSEKSLDREEYLLKKKIEYFTGVMDKLDLRDITLVMQDWGGSIGLGYAVEHADRIKRLIVMSTWAFVFPDDVPDEAIPPLLAMCRKPEIGETMLLACNMFIEGFLPLAIVRKEKITPQLMAAYRAPFPDYNSRIPTMAIQDVPLRADEPSYSTMKTIQEKLNVLSVPTCLIWGENDHVFPSDTIVPIWQGVYPHSELHMIPRAGHFLQEDAPGEIVAIMRDFLRRNP
ncbi:alpha/beta fold hydrolase [Candidatus Poribacteria bacterium]|nr:alpha/beta fold hydrolase [Candidatus Poribacteria bacterium]